MKRAHVVWFVVGLSVMAAVLASSCSGNEEATEAAPVGAVSTDAGGADGALGQDARPDSAAYPCAESWCAFLTGFCSTLTTLCVAPGVFLAQSEDWPSSCIGTSAAAIRRSGGDTASKAAALATCAKSAKSCDSLKACSKLINPDASGGGFGGVGEWIPGDKAEEDGQGAAPVIVDGGIAEAGPDAWILDGDESACVVCALDKCSAQSAHCFIDSYSAPACYPDGGKYPLSPDCCVDYRKCLAVCSDAYGDEVAAYYSCAKTDCDGHFKQGKAEFLGYQACMLTNCAGCADPKGGG